MKRSVIRGPHLVIKDMRYPCSLSKLRISSGLPWHGRFVRIQSYRFGNVPIDSVAICSVLEMFR